MAQPRSEQINLDVTPFYHCISKCVRGSYLNGVDRETGVDYTYRKEWLVAKMKHLSSIFAIKVCVYAVLCTHYHIVLYVDKALMEGWDDEAILRRWKALYPKDFQNFMRHLKSGVVSKEELEHKLSVWRERLISISNFMQFLNQDIARRANLEDDVKGHFWHNRFKSQAILDEGALISTMVYVDLNPIRAGMALTPEDSDFTSIQERILHAAKQITHPREDSPNITRRLDALPQPPSLMRMAPAESSLNEGEPHLPISFSDYLKLVDETGKIVSSDKRGAISNDLSPILQRIGMEVTGWMALVQGIEQSFGPAIGCEDKLFNYTKMFNRTRAKGQAFSRVCYS